MEDEKIHDIFQDMMTSVIKESPGDPIQFLIDRLTQPESKLHFFESFSNALF